MRDFAAREASGAGRRLLGLLAAATWFSCHPVSPVALATFDGGVVLPAEIPSGPVPEDPDDRATWVEAETRRRADHELVLAVAEARGLTEDPALRARVRGSVAVRLASARIDRLCPARKGGELERPWVEVRRLFVPVPEGADGETVAEAALELNELARTRDSGDTTESRERLYRDSAVEPRVIEAVWTLEDGERSEILRTDRGVELVWRESSGVDPAPDLQRRSASLEEALVELRRSVCPAALDGLLAEGEDEPGGSDLEFAVRLAEAEAPARERAEIERGELARVAVAETLAEQRRRIVASWPESELAAYFEARAGRFGAATFEEARERVVDEIVRERADDLDQRWLPQLRRERGLALDAEAIARHAGALGA